MNYYPVYLNLKDRPVLLVGGGAIGLQKLSALLDVGADIHVVSAEALPRIKALARDGKIKWSARSYKTADVKSASLVIAATDNSSLQKTIAKDARKRGIWVNIVDVPPLCDFIAPAIVSRGGIQIAISTGGAAPALAKHLRQKCEALIGEEYAAFVAVVSKLRPDILKMPKPRRRHFWKRVVSDAFFHDIKKLGIAKAEKQLRKLIYAK